MNSSKSASKRFWSRKPEKFQKESKYSRLKRRLLIMLSIVLALGLIYWTQTSSFWKSPKPGVSETTPTETVSLVTPRQDMSTQQLMNLASSLEVSNDSSLPEQMQWIKEKMELSQLLLAKTEDDDAQKEGTLYRLEALQRLSNLNRKYELGNLTVDTELYELSTANLSHTDPEIVKIAAVTIMLTAIHEFVIEPDAGNLKNALEKSRQMATQLKEDDEVAAAIFEYARAMKKSQLLVADSIEFFKIVLDSFWPNSNPKAQELARRAHAEILFGEQLAEPAAANLLVNALKDRIRRQHPYAEKEIANRIIYSLHRDLLLQSGIDQIFNIMEMLIVQKNLQLVTDLSNRLGQFIDQNQDSEIAISMSKRLEDLNLRIGQIDNVMDLSELTAISPEKNFDPINGAARLLVFWSPGEPSSVRFISSLYAQPLKRDIQVVAICTQSNADDAELLEKFAKEMPDFEFVKSSVDSGSSKLLANYPVPRLPYLLLLDKDGRLAATNPDPRDLSQQIHDLLN